MGFISPPPGVGCFSTPRKYFELSTRIHLPVPTHVSKNLTRIGIPVHI